MAPEDRSRQEKPEDSVQQEESPSSESEPLDSILQDMVGALKSVREVLAHTVQNFPVLEEDPRVVIAVRRSDGSTVQVPGAIDESSD